MVGVKLGQLAKVPDFLSLAHGVEKLLGYSASLCRGLFKQFCGTGKRFLKFRITGNDDFKRQYARSVVTEEI